MKTTSSLRLAARILPLLLLCAVASLHAADAPSPAAQLQALLQEYQKAQAEFSGVYKTAKTAEELAKIINATHARYPQLQKYAGRFLELAQKYPQDPVAVDALIWVANSPRFGAEVDQAMGILLKDHLQSEKLGRLCQALEYGQSPQAEKLLRDIIAQNPPQDMQGEYPWRVQQGHKAFPAAVAAGRESDCRARCCGHDKDRLAPTTVCLIGEPGPRAGCGRQIHDFVQ